MRRPFKRSLIGRAKQTWVQTDYAKRRCSHPGCDAFPHFGFGPPLTNKTRYSCRAHRASIEETINQEKKRV